MKTLNLRLTLYLLLPVGTLLLLTGAFGFFYAKGIMLEAWREGAILKLQRAAHHLDMRLEEPMAWIRMIEDTPRGRGSYAIQQWVLDRLRDLQGVAQVELQTTAQEEGAQAPQGSPLSFPRGRELPGYPRGRAMKLSAPRLDIETGEETVDLVVDLETEGGLKQGSLKVRLRFEYLMQDITALGWWQSDEACLVDGSGRYLTHTASMNEGNERLGEGGDPLERELLVAIGKEPFGTILGPGHPPVRVAGFYRMSKAPWSLILFAPGGEVLAPIIRFRLIYALVGALGIVAILLMIRVVTWRLVSSVREISTAAGKVARGEYGAPVPVRTRDEIGQLSESFNLMVEGLKERDFLANTFGRYVDQDLARELLKRPEAARLGGERREVAILMSDIRGFTAMTEDIAPEGIIRFLNRFFGHHIAIIQRHRGIIVDFFGDGILAFFDPLGNGTAPTLQRALFCAMDMQRIMAQINEENLASAFPEVKMGIGVTPGDVIVGNIGSEARAKYGIVGSAVHIAHRIQAVAEGGEVLVPEPVQTLLPDGLGVLREIRTSLKGLRGTVRLFSLIEGTQEKGGAARDGS